MTKFYAISAYNMHGIADRINAIRELIDVLSVEVSSVAGQPGHTRLQALILVSSIAPEDRLDRAVGDVLDQFERRG